MLISRGGYCRNLKCWESGLKIRGKIQNPVKSKLQIESFNWLKTKAQSVTVYLVYLAVPGVKRGHAGGCAGLGAAGLWYSLLAAEVETHYYSGQSAPRHQHWTISDTGMAH